MYIKGNTGKNLRKNPQKKNFNKILNETNLSDLWSEYNGNKDWFEHLDKLNPEKSLPSEIKTKLLKNQQQDISDENLTMDNNLT